MTRALESEGPAVGRRPMVAAVAAVLVCLGLVALPGQASAKAAALSSATVSPRTGTTATTFVFSVHYAGTATPISITARVAATTVTLTRISGSVTNGTWRGSRRLPIGTFGVTFVADLHGSNDPTLAAGQVKVTAAPTPTPRPTPTPQPTPAPKPSSAPPPATPRPTPKPTATSSPTAAHSAAPSPTAPSTPTAIGGAAESSPSPTAVAVASTAGNQTGSLLLAALLGVLVIVGVGGIALLAGRRRAEEEPPDGPPVALVPARPGPVSPGSGTPAPVTPAPVITKAEAAAFAARVAPPPPAAEPPTQPKGAWDAFGDIDDRPIGTVDRLPPGDYQRRPHGEG